MQVKFVYSGKVIGYSHRDGTNPFVPRIGDRVVLRPEETDPSYFDVRGNIGPEYVVKAVMVTYVDAMRMDNPDITYVMLQKAMTAWFE